MVDTAERRPRPDVQTAPNTSAGLRGLRTSMRAVEAYRRRNPDFFAQLRPQEEDALFPCEEDGLLTREQFIERQLLRDEQIRALPVRDEYLRERIRATMNWGDNDDLFFARASAYCTLYGRYERDLKSTNYQHRRAWKRILRDRVHVIVN